jgi:hypothetical protein
VRPWACAPYRPQTKGKVESGVKYVQRNALAGNRFHSWAHLNAWLLEWATTVADVRVHGTTHEVPLARGAQEALTPLGSRYSVPARLVGATVEVHESATGFAMHYADILVAEHVRRPRQQVIMDPAHYVGLVERRDLAIHDALCDVAAVSA